MSAQTPAGATDARRRRSRWKALLRWACRIVFLLFAFCFGIALGLPHITNLPPVRNLVTASL